MPKKTSERINTKTRLPNESLLPAFTPKIETLRTTFLAIPTIFIIDKKGVIRYSNPGLPKDKQVIQQTLEELLNEPAPEVEKGH